jgi:hypothetical protein
MEGPTGCVGVKRPFFLAILFFKQGDSLVETTMQYFSSDELRKIQIC